jgi:DNA polymerase III subunit gamma/tau
VAYVSLYRKYRPQSFADVVGQDHVTRTLVHAIEEDRLHHAYLFTGPRGTGKTSTARILAKAINCEQGPTPTPCNACGSCESITNGSSVDVIELDMASHGGVDDARELRERALFAPANSRRKVYILDEVHMASTAAFNALLKLVEEPPGHVLFAMATTDPQKVLPTILSRVQRLDLRRVSAVDVSAHVRKVCEAEGYTIDAGAVDEVVRAGDGSVRDTLSVLEQVLAYAGVEVTAEAVGQVLGRTPAERVVETVDRLAERDLAGLFGMVQGLLDDGHDLRRFTLDLVQHLRDLLVLQVAPDRPDLVDATDERRRRLQAQAPSIPSDTMLRAVDLLAQTVAEQRQGSPRLPLELALARLATPGADGDLTELVDRIARLEAGVAPAARAGSFPRARAGSSDVTAREASARSPGHTRPPSSAADADEASGGAASAASSADAAEASSGGAALAASSADAAEASGSDAAPPGVGRAPGSAAGSTAPGSPTEATGEARPPAEVGSSTGSAAVSAPDPATASDPVTTPAPTTASDPATSPSEPAASSDPVADLPSSGSAPSDPAVPSEPAAASEPVTPSGPATPSEPATSPSEPVGSSEPADAASEPIEDLDSFAPHWAGILELVRASSRRCHAMFEPATPAGVSGGILTLRYAQRYASFHAANAQKAEFSDVLRDAIDRATGSRLRVQVVIEGQDARRRPTPPSVTPDDARTPVLDDPASPDPEPSAGGATAGETAAAPTGSAATASAATASAAAPGSGGSDAAPGSTPGDPSDGSAGTDESPAATEEVEVREAELEGTPTPDPDVVDDLLATELGATLLEERPASAPED